MDRIPLVVSSTALTPENYWSSVFVYHDRPHLVNRKLAAVEPLFICQIIVDSDKYFRLKNCLQIFTRHSILFQLRKTIDRSKLNLGFIKELVDPYYETATVREIDSSTLHEAEAGVFVSVRLLIPRQKQRKNLEIVLLAKDETKVRFIAVQENDENVAPKIPYEISLNKHNLEIALDNFEDADTSSAAWLADKLFPKLLTWSENQHNQTIQSLSLISAPQYCDLYAEMKEKYGGTLVKMWPQKAKTDPQKYVYEDIAIATYLMCLWGSQKSDVTFVDCGCGNGLLVYILNCEGYKGWGIDVRSRQTWELYQNKADLRQGTITPDSVFPEATWIVGNHSDELTPWIPIIALKSSPKTNYFVLPCCSHDLSGKKYVRQNSAVTQYEDYMEYIKHISTICGFKTAIDKLRIPSTKRTCLVGSRDSLHEAEMKKIHSDVSEFIEKRSKYEFEARNPEEKIKNCTQLNRNLIERIVNLMSKQLLEINNLISQAEDGAWNQGGNISLEHLVMKLTPEDRKALKAECGGLQTLLKNHRYIFDVRGGTVSLRKPPSIHETDKYKNKPCWFHLNHPSGCYHRSETCAYKH